MSGDNIILNSCQYTPIYFIESPGVSQPKSYVFTQNNQTVDKPVGENLKRFYENSGKLESNLNVAESSKKPKKNKKHDSNVVRNNLKLASFLLPKCETKNELIKPMIAPANNVVLKPVYIANNISVNNTNTPSQVQKLDVNSRIVKLRDLPNIVRCQNGKILPKIKPKENTSSTTSNKLKPTVQLVRLGETYHSLDQLSNDQRKMVNHALHMFSNSQTNPPEPAYDPATNTKFIYKVVSQKDLPVADRNKVNKQINADNIKKDIVKIEKTEIVEEEPKANIEAKVTRSGRVVKLPKNIILDDSPTKPKKKIGSIVSCVQCTTKFSSPQRLHRHYENHPSHLPNKLHNNLFHCLMAIVTAGSENERANILIQQLEQLIDKLKSCIPCLLKSGVANENLSLVNEDISKLFGIHPGKYNFNVEALSCEKDKDGYCSHSPRPQPVICTENIKPHITLIENNENSIIKGPANTLKSNFSERRPTILRKVECRKQKLEQNSHNINGKKMKLSQDIDSNSNSIGIDAIVALLSDTAKTDNKLETKAVDKVVLNNQRVEVNQVTAPENVVTKPQHIQFHSTHFDIRSSPIKPTSTVFRKFQINPEKMAKYEIEIIRPIQLNQLAQDVEMTIDSNISGPEILSDTNVLSKESEALNNICTEDWSCDESCFTKPSDLINTHSENFMKSNTLVEQSLLHVENGTKLQNGVTNHGRNIMESHISIEPELLLAQNNHKDIDKSINQTDDFIKPDILIEQALLLAQNDYKVTDKIDDQTDDFIKSNMLLEPELLHSQSNEKVLDNFSDDVHNYMRPHENMNPTISNDNRVMNVTENNDMDIDLATNHGQSIMSFLESLGNELAYTETESRNNSVDFQLDLFSFNNS